MNARFPGKRGLEVERDNGEHSAGVRCISAQRLCFMSASGGADAVCLQKKRKVFQERGKV